MQYQSVAKAEYLFISSLVALSVIPTVLHNSKKIINCLTKCFGRATLIFLFIALLAINTTAHANFIISLTEVPEWAPGYPIKTRYIIVDDKGSGSVVVTNQHDGIAEVLEVAQFRYNPGTFADWVSEYHAYKNFYGVDEDSDGVIVEGNPQAVVLSFYSNGRLAKSVNLSGELAYNDKPDAQFQLPASLIALRDKLLLYARNSEPQPRSEYYTVAVPYGENEKYWLLRSTQLEAIPAISDLSDKRGRAFLTKLVENAATFLPLEESFFLKLKNNIGLSSYQFQKIFRVSTESDIIVQIKFMKSAPPK